MGQSTSHPDCVHCRFMVHNKNGEYRCRQHNMTLHTPVSIFCKLIAAPEASDADYQHWFQNTIHADMLDANTLYTWVETPARTGQGEKQVMIDAEIVAPLRSYLSWSAGTFWQILRNLRLAKRTHYKQHGYNIDDGQ